MEVTNEQIASDIVRNLSVALAELVKADIDNYTVKGGDLIVGIERKLQKWIGDL